MAVSVYGSARLADAYHLLPFQGRCIICAAYAGEVSQVNKYQMCYVMAYRREEVHYTSFISSYNYSLHNSVEHLFFFGVADWYELLLVVLLLNNGERYGAHNVLNCPISSWVSCHLAACLPV